MKATFRLIFPSVILMMGLIFCTKKDTLDSIYPDLPITVANDYGHPRLLLSRGEEAQIREIIASDEIWEEMHFTILETSQEILKEPFIERQLSNGNMLSKAMKFLKRVFYLSYAYRMTEGEQYLKRAEEEMLHVASFTDWNPSHFLDAAEITMGMAIGYDWLYDQLSPGSRKIIREAIKTKGIEPSFVSEYNDDFIDEANNWNQVCNAGLTLGALAILDSFPDLANQTIQRAVETIKQPMEKYQPDGAYPEGYQYWRYGTGMNVLFLSAIEKFYGSDFGLTQKPGFLETAEFLEHMIGNTAQCFNWGDCTLQGKLNPAMFWFAQRTNNLSLLWMEKHFLEEKNFSVYATDRLLPAIMIWARGIPLNSITAPASKFWVGQGDNPVCLMRTSWTDPNAIYLGFKAGSSKVNHGHMDVGSFIMESDGVRWASDLGKESYGSLRSHGLSIFGDDQDDDRWFVFRHNNFSHNTLTIDGALQRVDGYAKIDEYSADPKFAFAISDISSVYDGQIKEAKRGVGIVEEKYVIVWDEVTTLSKPTKIRWAMLTEADVALNGHRATLTKDGKKLYFKVESPSDVQLKTWSTGPPNDFDAPNPGTVLLGFELELPPDSSERFQVYLLPEQAYGSILKNKKQLSDW